MFVAFNPFFQYCDDNGYPLVNGRLVFLVHGTTTLADIYSDKDGTPLANPVLLDASGRVPNNGVFISGILYTVQVQRLSHYDAYGQPVYQTVREIAGVRGISDAVSIESLVVVLDWDALKDIPNPSGSALMLGRVSAGDGGGGLFAWSASSVAPDNGGTICASNTQPTGRWIREYHETVNLLWFGADRTGYTSSQSAITGADSYAHANGMRLLFPPGAYKISSDISIFSSCLFESGARFTTASVNDITVYFARPIDAPASSLRTSTKIRFTMPYQECKAEWIGVDRFNSPAQNATNITGALYQCDHTAIVFEHGTYAIQSASIVNPVIVKDGAAIDVFSDFYASTFIGAKGSIVLEGGAEFLTGEMDIRVSWFMADGVSGILAFQRACASCGTGRAVIVDRTLNLNQDYSMPTTASLKIEDGERLIINANIGLNDVSASSRFIKIDSGTLVFANTPSIKLSWFFDYSTQSTFTKILQIAQDSSAELDCERLPLIDIMMMNVNIKIRNLVTHSLYITSTIHVQTVIELIDSSINSIFNVSGFETTFVYASNCVFGGESSLAQTTCVNCRFIMRTTVYKNVRLISCEFADDVSLYGTQIDNIHILNGSFYVSDTGGTTKGRIVFDGNANIYSSISNVVIDATFYGSPHDTTQCIVKNGIYYSIPSAHKYSVTARTAHNYLVAQSTEVCGRDIMLQIPGTNKYTLTLYISTHPRFLEFGTTNELWSISAVPEFAQAADKSYRFNIDYSTTNAIKLELYSTSTIDSDVYVRWIAKRMT